ncbi:flagellar motor switch protein FliM [Sphingomonas oleivorans]|uniref:Flagellar motor switch protein FliM n=1 Tax=Sphingomonas oleivorans TaxID=1735121 RepID=A0A2T5FYF7_9SPHN|nr:FliM/FliN family flagellar motor switch protein [Sphingomonas oleivorans]PTQ11542.1 flagellar motor switch protein FliM [Sphingomonas oleivorans]
MTGISPALDETETAILRDELADAAPGAPFSRDVRKFALGRESVHPTARLSGLRRMGDRLARGLRSVIEPLANARTQVTALAPETQRFDQWMHAQPDFTSLSLYRLRPLKGGMLIALEPNFIAALVDSFYGGSGIVAAKTVREFTPSEERLLSRLTDAIVAALVEAWAEVTPLAPQLVSRETNPAHAALVRPDEAVAVQKFTVQPGVIGPSSVAILYPLATLRPIEEELAAKTDEDATPGKDAWRARLATALEQVRLPVRSVLARPEISVSQLLALKPGDVIPITLFPRAPLIAGTKRLAEGVIGEQEGRAALMIERMGDKMSDKSRRGEA